MTQNHVVAENAGFLFVYFTGERELNGEQIRFAVSDGPLPVAWSELRDGQPILVSDIGEHGVRDPFIVRDSRRGRFFVLATDLRIGPAEDWARSTAHGSRSLVIWESADLVTWSAPRLVQVAPPEAGNAWAPKAFWSVEHDAWLVFWASALYETSDRNDDRSDERTEQQYQRMMRATTTDFRTFSEPEVYLDAGFNVIDATFLNDGDDWYRFSASEQVAGGSADTGHHILVERGQSLTGDFSTLAVDVGKGFIERGEGPAVAQALDGNSWYLLIDEFLLRGYTLFESTDLASGHWSFVESAQMPPGARHGSLLAITADERERLLRAFDDDASRIVTHDPIHL
ncbi:glycoside hydrolase family 43 protein [Subtercola endophyticus]|uniref:glycoside hydrolase family 43 protein n=1 Tax=Subtercola endophyticus TaxID=2895559 RepID=UPI001E480D3A|nr:glycoside hydrolase family 43 protein [Subtercola endophyticus]UFS59936.1 glycoside hydrolase family 43 protein [Subtercola endophyticus]